MVASLSGGGIRVTYVMLGLDAGDAEQLVVQTVAAHDDIGVRVDVAHIDEVPDGKAIPAMPSSPKSIDSWIWHAGLLLGGIYLGLFLFLSQDYDYDVVGGLVVGPVVALVGVVLVPRLFASEPDAVVRRLIGVSYALKIVSAVAIYSVTYLLYGAGDSDLYDRAGTLFAHQIWQGDFVLKVHGQLVGTNFVGVATGWVYALIGPTKLGGFLVFALLGWAGQYLFYRAFRLAVPDGNRRWYTALVLLLPSLLFWPSTIGKESWMMLMLGMASYGVARWFTHRRGLAWMGLGVLGMVMVRPHIAVFVFAALAGAVALGSGREAAGARAGSRVVMVAVLLVVGPVLGAQTQQFLNADGVSVAATNQVLEDIAGTTDTGGSAFSNTLVQSPLDVPVAFVSVLMRPFPFEAQGPLTLLSSLEGVALAVILWRRRGALRRLPAAMRRRPYVAYAAVYTLLFVIGFSSFNNLGLLVRERTQVFPFLLGCACIPLATDKDRDSAEEPQPVEVGLPASR